MTARDAWGQVAHDLRALAESIDRAVESGRPVEQPQQAAAVDAGAGEPPSPSPRPARQESAFTRCPAHNKEWSDGKYGPYCASKEPEDVPHDGNWYNDRGYCRVTPKSAGAWLKQHPRAA